jgi:hypothetical protein
MPCVIKHWIRNQQKTLSGLLSREVRNDLRFDGTIDSKFAAKETLEHPGDKERVRNEVSLPETAWFLNEAIGPFHP